MRRQRPLLILLALVVWGCGSSGDGAPTTSIGQEDWESLADRGLAIAPVAGVKVLAASPGAPAYFTDELFISLEAALPGISVVSPDDAFARLEAAGPDAQSRLRSLRRRLLREEPLVPTECSALAQDLAERFLFVTFMNEGSAEDLSNMELDDYRAFDYSMGVHRYPTGELHGLALGFVVDLEAGQRIWRTEIEYVTEGLSTYGNASQRLIDRTRADAAFRLAEALAGSDVQY